MTSSHDVIVIVIGLGGPIDPFDPIAPFDPFDPFDPARPLLPADASLVSIDSEGRR